MSLKNSEKVDMSGGKAFKTAFKQAARKNAWIRRGTSKRIASISSPSLEVCSSSVGSQSGIDLLCTFNWASVGEPSIFVPGAPPQWTPKELPVDLPKDSGTYFIDQNGQKVPSCPYTPLFNALRIMRPSFDFTAVDLLTSRNSLRKLLKFSANRVTESFRIDLHMVQGTLIMVRHERNTRQIIHGSKNSGYGHTFEAAFTTPENGLEASCGHHRIINYALGDLNCVVQFEVDAWYEAGNTSCDSTSFQSDPNEILSSFTNLSLSESAAPHASGGLSVLQRGRNITSSKLAEIKSRCPNAIHLNEALPQLWLGRTPYLLVGLHDKGNGVFRSVDIVDAAAKFPAWEKQNQTALRRLSRLIVELRRITQETDDGACIVTCDHTIKPAQLEIFEPSKSAKKFALPQEFIEMFWRKSAG